MKEGGGKHDYDNTNIHITHTLPSQFSYYYFNVLLMPKIVRLDWGKGQQYRSLGHN